MTNYEWLVKNNLLRDFLYDMDGDTTDHENFHKYQIRFKGDRDFRDEIADWLQAERPNNAIRLYVPLDHVIDIIQYTPVKFTDISDTVDIRDKCFCFRDLKFYVSRHCADLYEEICALPVKEIVDD